MEERILDKIAYADVFRIVYLLAPFFAVFVMAVFKNIKNPLYIRRISRAFFCFEAILFFVADFFATNSDFYIKNLHFAINLQDKILIYVSVFCFLVFVNFSKTFVKFAKKQFYLILILLFGVLNLFVVSDNINVSVVFLFWLILVKFLISNIAQKDNIDKRELKKHCALDFVCYFVGIALIGYDFLRYFILNSIPFEFSNVSEYFSRIDDFTVSVAFLGFLVLIFGQLGFLNIFNKYNKTYTKLPLYNISICTFVQFVVGISLLFKVYDSFSCLFYQYQNQISIFILVVVLYNTIISFKQNNLFYCINSVFIANIFIGIFSAFAFDKIDSSFAFYYFVVLIVSYIPVLLVFAYLENIFKTKCIEDYKRINDKTNIIQFNILFFLLNFAKMPISSNFLSFLVMFLAINSIEYNNIFLKSLPCVFLVCVVLLGICVLNLVYKILIEPVESDKNRHLFLNHQKVTFASFFIVLYVLLFAIQSFMNNFKV